MEKKHINVLDGFRVLFIALIACYHIWQQSWLDPSFSIGSFRVNFDLLLRSGYIWVDGLLLLSAFLLYLPWTEGGETPSAKAFYKRRAARIVPSYLFCVLPLFVYSVIQGYYPSIRYALNDLVPHLLFVHPWFPASSQYTLLNGALWTLGVEMEFYLLFPLLARCFRKRPVWTWCGMAAIAWAYRAIVARLDDPSPWINQLPAFFDVFANGFVAAQCCAALRKRLEGKRDKLIQLFFSVTCVLCFWLLLRIANDQSYSNQYDSIQLGQLARRFGLSVVVACAMVCAVFSLPAMQALLGNRAVRFLAGISMNFYIWHQYIAVKIKEWKIVPSVSPYPWTAGETAWKWPYSLLCLGAAFVFAVLVTYLVERPCAELLRGTENKKREETKP